MEFWLTNLTVKIGHQLNLEHFTKLFLQCFLFPLNFISQIMFIIFKWNQFLAIIVEIIVTIGMAFCNYNCLVMFY